MPKSSTVPWQRHPQPRPIGYEERARRKRYKGHSFRLVLEPVDGPQYSPVALIAFLIALGLLVAVVAIKFSSLLLILAKAGTAGPYDGPITTMVLGALSLAAIVLGHIGLRQIQTGVRRGLVMAGFTLGAGYSILVIEAFVLLGTF